ncbi:MAG: heme lyase CcmF/NrfE family subunit [Hyphomicrobiales bacterium]|nr:heme lyase CcmF/NrfE family subunit [Hyphomicrobiales bacterium]MDE2113787.1 heme lyase CcmF/NrfE family subunit [Hyphomicrobiales bacterium]
MIVEIGHFALILALALALVQTVVPLTGTLTRDASLMAVAAPIAIFQFVLVTTAFLALMYAHVVSDFSVANVYENSHSLKPLIYKISGVWGDHEGSMLLWIFILASFGAAVAVFSRHLPNDLRANVLSVQGLIGAAFLAFTLLTSNPFMRLLPAPLEGRDLNPILQDPGLAIHPPLLYLGYVGFSVTFSFAAAALISGRIDPAWARYVRPWTLIAWIFLTLGIAMGSYWAYYSLGWGGFWFWDPVENASLMPWLAGTALLHSVSVMEKRDALKVWTIFLAVLAFSLSLLGTFLVRSGVLTSVHAFASDPRRGVYILAILVFFIGGSLALFAWRASALKPGGIFAPISREGGLVLNNLLLTASCATVVVGTLYPLLLESLTGQKISVGPPFFNLSIAPFALILVLSMPVGQLLAWKRGSFLGAAQRLMFAILAGIAAALIMAALHGGPVLAPIGAGLAIYLIFGSVVDIYSRVFARGATSATALARARGLPRAAWGASLAHAGFGLTLLGLAATGWGVERIVNMAPATTYALGPYQVIYDKVEHRKGPNYDETYTTMRILDDNRLVAQIEPSKRFYPARKSETTEAGIKTLWLGQVYVSIASEKLDGTVDARLYWKPLVSLIWLGALIMALGGLVSISDQRVRIGFARRAGAARAKAGLQPAE